MLLCPTWLSSVAVRRQLQVLLGGIREMPPGEDKLLLVMQVVGPLWLPETAGVTQVRCRLLLPSVMPWHCLLVGCWVGAAASSEIELVFCWAWSVFPGTM